jgi:hypothetical protein
MNTTIDNKEYGRDTRPPPPSVVICESCGKRVNLMTMECAGCSD